MPDYRVAGELFNQSEFILPGYSHRPIAVVSDIRKSFIFYLKQVRQFTV